MSEKKSDGSHDWLDFKDPKKVAYGLGKAAAAIGVGVLLVQGGKKVFVAYGDRRTREKGLISVGVIEEGGMAISAAEEEGALERQGLHKDWFAMGQEGFAYPGEQSADGSKYLRVAQNIWEMIKDHVPGLPSEEQQLDEKQ